MMPQLKNYYRILQVDPAAEPEVITAAYKRLALKYHPDTSKSPDATRRMQDINEAYEILSNPARKEQFDRELLRRREAKRAANMRRSPNEGEQQGPVRNEKRRQATQAEPVGRRTEDEPRRRTATDADAEIQRNRAKADKQHEEEHQLNVLRQRAVHLKRVRNTVLGVGLAIAAIPLILSFRALGAAHTLSTQSDLVIDPQLARTATGLASTATATRMPAPSATKPPTPTRTATAKPTKTLLPTATFEVISAQNASKLRYIQEFPHDTLTILQSTGSHSYDLSTFSRWPMTGTCGDQPGFPISCSISRTSQRLAFLNDGVLEVWDFQRGQRILQVDVAPTFLYTAISADGKLVSIIDPGRDNPPALVAVFETATGELLHSFEPSLWGPSYYLPFTVSPTDGYLVLAGCAQLSGGNSGYCTEYKLDFWDMAQGVLLRTLIGGEEAISRVVFSADGTLLATQSDFGNTISIWDATRLKMLGQIQVDGASAISQIAVSPDGLIIATASILVDRVFNTPELNLRLYDTASGELKAELKEPAPNEYSAIFMTFANDGRSIALAYWEPASTVKIYAVSQ